MDNKPRIDKYLWSIRVYSTRSKAADACEKGKVKLNGVAVKASRTVTVGDEYEIRGSALPGGDVGKKIIKVTALLDHRVQYSEAINHYSDITPPEELDSISFDAPSFHTGKRLSKIGRPTKKDFRDINKLMDC